MQNRRYKRTSVNIDNNLYLMSVSEGLEITPFLNRCLSLFFEVPENPRDKLIKERSEYFVLKLKQDYEREVKKILQENAAQTLLEEPIKIKEQELIEFGNLLKKTSAYPILKLRLSVHDMDLDVLDIVTTEINKMNGRSYDNFELWNRAIDWYNKYGLSEVPA